MFSHHFLGYLKPQIKKLVEFWSKVKMHVMYEKKEELVYCWFSDYFVSSHMGG